MRSILSLVWKNGLAYLLVEPGSTYDWWFLLILSGLATACILWPALLLIVLFNAIVVGIKSGKAKHHAWLGAALGLVFFSCAIPCLDGGWKVLFQNFLLVGLVGVCFGFYHYRLIRPNST